MKLLNVSAVLFAYLVFLTGCAIQPLSLAYIPQSVSLGHASLNVGAFRFEPAEAKHVKSNQIPNTAAGEIFIDKDVSEYVKRAFALEMDRSGFLSASPKALLHCDIKKLLRDDLGWSVDWYFDVACRVVDIDTHTEIARDSVSIKKTGWQKGGGVENFQRALNNIISEAYEKLFSSASIKRALKASV